jgi:hypothetical protein
MTDKTAIQGHKHHCMSVDGISHTICATEGTGMNSRQGTTNRVNSHHVFEGMAAVMSFQEKESDEKVALLCQTELQ